MDSAIEAASVEPDKAKRKALIDQIQRIAQTDLPILPLFDKQHFSIYNAKLQGVSDAVDGAMAPLDHVWLQH